MKKEYIEQLVREGMLRIRQPDNERIKSLIKSAEIDADAAKQIALSDATANIIFKSLYDAIRQLADAQWWLQGYEPEDHKTALESLNELSIKEKTKLNFLDRFRRIRNDASYRGFRISVLQAQEMIDFWKLCGKEIIEILRTQIK